MKAILQALVMLMIIIALPLTGCSPTITREEAEKEIVSFMVETILQKPEGESTGYVQTNSQPWLNPPPSAILIVYSPANKTDNKNSWEQVEFGEPIQVWWFFDNNLVEATDKQVAVQKYGEKYIYGGHDWSSYEFGILSISSNNQKATLYESISSCPDCAGGMILTLERNDSGEWEITDSELLWLS